MSARVLLLSFLASVPTELTATCRYLFPIVGIMVLEKARNGPTPLF